jgi:hypothetical protein
LVDPHPLDTSRELIAIDRISIAKQESWSRLVRERLDELASRPDGRGVVRDVEVEEFAAVIPEDDEGAEEAAGERGDEKEVDGGLGA